MIVSVSEAVKKTVIIPAVLTVAWMRSFVQDDAPRPMEHGFGILGRIAAGARGFLHPKSSYGSKERRE